MNLPDNFALEGFDFKRWVPGSPGCSSHLPAVPLSPANKSGTF